MNLAQARIVPVKSGYEGRAVEPEMMLTTEQVARYHKLGADHQYINIEPSKLDN